MRRKIDDQAAAPASCLSRWQWPLLLALASAAPAFGQPVPSQPPEQPAPDAALSDPAFEEALPPLDAVTPEAASAEPPAPPPEPAAEAELAAPLPPLAQFDAAPPAQTPSEAAKGDAPRQLRYRVEIDGLKQVGLEGRFRDLSVLVRDGYRAANIAQIQSRADEDVALAGRLLRSEGYFDGLATASVPASVGQEEVVPVSLAATPGNRYRLGQITLTGLAPDPYPLARAALALNGGDPIVAPVIEEAEARIALRLPEQGYPFVTVGQRDILLDPATHVGDYTLPVTSGPKASFGDLKTEGDAVFGLDHLAVFPRFRRGQLYDSRRVDDLRQALVGTSLFSTIAVEPVRTGDVAADGTETVDLLVRQARGRARTLAASAGYGTGEGVKLMGEWTHRNLFPPEGALIVDATAGTQLQGVGATFRRSNAGRRDRTVQARAAVSRQRFDAYNAETFDLSASIARQSTPIWQKRWTYTLGAELLATRETPFDPTRATRPKSTYLIAALPSQLGYDTSNSLLDPTRGFRVNLRLSPEAQKQTSGGFDGYLRSLAEASGYYSVSDNIVLAARARAGSIVGAARDSIAPSRRLYAGGGGSVRGFGFQQLGPKDANNDPVGGRSLTEFALEARYRFGPYGIVPFVDAGRVGTGVAPGISGLRYGLGIGARYYTNFGPFRIDVATPMNRRKGEAKVALYLSIGQAF